MKTVGGLTMEELFYLQTEDGNKQQCKVVLTFDSDEHSYVIYSFIDEEGNESEDVSALRYELDDEGNMTDFSDLETEEEWEMVEEVLNTFIADSNDEDSEFFTVTDENDQELLCEVLYKFELKEFGKHYVLYSVAEEDEEIGELFAAEYTPGENGEVAQLHPIETEEEWEKVEEQLAFMQGNNEE